MTDLVTDRISIDDGTSIAWHSVGEGPDIVLLHGAMQIGASQRDLAGLLADRYRVHLVDRRGRGDSTGASADSTSQEISDLRRVLEATGATRVFGVSTGAIVAARAALDGARIERLALFEPPLPIQNSMVNLDRAPGLVEALERGKLAHAMGIAMRVAEMGPPWMFGLPIPVLAALSSGMLRTPDSKRLALGLRADFAVVAENVDSIADFGAISVPTLLINGTLTRPYLRTAVDQLSSTIPNALRVELLGQWHSATQNLKERGRPDLVAPHLASFFV